MNWLYFVAGGLAFGFATGWQVQDWRQAEQRAATAQEAQRLTEETLQKATLARDQTEVIRSEYIEYRKEAEGEIAALAGRVAADKPERLRIAAKCPSVPAVGANAGRVESGTAELDATATATYFTLERGLAEQFGLLQLCRAELQKRSL